MHLEHKHLMSMSLSRLSALILYNLALSYHMQSIFTTTATTGTLKKAVHLYEHAYRVASTRDNDQGGILLYAILNNLAHVHYQLRNVQQADNLCSALYHAMLQQNNQQGRPRSSSMDGFVQNVTRLSPSNVIAPAA